MKIEVTHVGAWLPHPGDSRHGRPSGRFYLFEIDLPVVDVIDATGIFWGIRQNGKRYTTKKGDGSEFTMMSEDPEFELFFQSASPEEFKTHPYDDYPADWDFTPVR